MPRDLPDVWRDEDGPSPRCLDRWTSGDILQLALDEDGRRVVRIALKTAWHDSPNHDQHVIDEILDRLKR